MSSEKKSILYIGNDLSKSTNYKTMMSTLTNLLIKDEFIVDKSSSKNNKLLRLLDMCFSIIKKRKKTDYLLIDTFSTSNFYYAFLTSQLARFFNLKYIPILHGGNLPSRISKSINLSNLIFKNSYYNVAPSNYLKSEFEKRGYKTLFIPNVLEIEKYQFKERKDLQPKILWVRAFKHLYNPLLAIEVLKIIKEKYSEVTLCMIGPVKDASFDLVKEKVIQEGLDSNIEFTGVLSKDKWHERSKDFDIFINTTNFDNTPVSVMEAMALGLPIISTNVGGMPYLIQNGKDGILVEKENEKLMAEEVIKLIENGAHDMILSARKKAESFAWENVKKKWLEILK
jgi:glycosyltransferase involved in cell wall biosynthesis